MEAEAGFDPNDNIQRSAQEQKRRNKKKAKLHKQNEKLHELEAKKAAALESSKIVPGESYADAAKIGVIREKEEEEIKAFPFKTFEEVEEEPSKDKSNVDERVLSTRADRGAHVAIEDNKKSAHQTLESIRQNVSGGEVPVVDAAVDALHKAANTAASTAHSTVRLLSHPEPKAEKASVEATEHAHEAVENAQKGAAAIKDAVYHAGVSVEENAKWAAHKTNAIVQDTWTRAKEAVLEKVHETAEWVEETTARKKAEVEAEEKEALRVDENIKKDLLRDYKGNLPSSAHEEIEKRPRKELERDPEYQRRVDAVVRDRSRVGEEKVNRELEEQETLELSRANLVTRPLPGLQYTDPAISASRAPPSTPADVSSNHMVTMGPAELIHRAVDKMKEVLGAPLSEGVSSYDVIPTGATSEMGVIPGNVITGSNYGSAPSRTAAASELSADEADRETTLGTADSGRVDPIVPVQRATAVAPENDGATATLVDDFFESGRILGDISIQGIKNAVSKIFSAPGGDGAQASDADRAREIAEREVLEQRRDEAIAETERAIGLITADAPIEAAIPPSDLPSPRTALSQVPEADREEFGHAFKHKVEEAFDKIKETLHIGAVREEADRIADSVKGELRDATKYVEREIGPALEGHRAEDRMFASFDRGRSQ
eukprot:ANDGO_05383.mRNA.1 hypothetical protein